MDGFGKKEENSRKLEGNKEQVFNRTTEMTE